MSYATGTTHYNLPQTVGSDKRDWTDTNQAFSDIDAAIYGAAQGASAATSAIETINGEIETITGKQAVDEGNISTLAGKVSTLESTVGTQGAAIADVRQDLQDNIESNHEASATSTHLYNIGDTFYYNDVLYKATAEIAIGGTIVPSTNCTAVTVMSELARVEAEIPSDKGYAEVVSTGNSDTSASMLATLGNLIDFSKVSYSSRFEIYIPSSDTHLCVVFQMATYNPTSKSIVVSEVTNGANGMINNAITCSASTSAAGNGWIRANALTTGTTVEDLSSATQAAGIRFRLYY